MDNFRRRTSKGKTIVSTTLIVTNMVLKSHSVSQLSGSILLQDLSTTIKYYCPITFTFTVDVYYNVVLKWSNGDEVILKQDCVEKTTEWNSASKIIAARNKNSAYVQFVNTNIASGFYIKDYEYDVDSNVWYTISRNSSDPVYFGNISNIGDYQEGYLVVYTDFSVIVGKGRITKISNDRVDYQFGPV